MAKMLAFDPADRVTVFQALEHPWLAAYHDESDEPVCTEKFERWREIEKLETIEDFRTALWNEIEDYRREVRGIHLLPPMPAAIVDVATTEEKVSDPPPHAGAEDAGMEEQRPEPQEEKAGETKEEVPTSTETSISATLVDVPLVSSPPPLPQPSEPLSTVPEVDAGVKLDLSHSGGTGQILDNDKIYSTSPKQYRTDPLVTYARRSSILQPSRQGSTYNSPIPSYHHLPTFLEDHESKATSAAGATATVSNLGPGTVAFPSMHGQGYVVPARSRTGSTAGGEVTRKLLRTLSTVSIHESSQGRVGGLADNFAFLMSGMQSEADAPPSEVPMDFAIAGEENEVRSRGSGEGGVQGGGDGARKGKQRGPLFQL